MTVLSAAYANAAKTHVIADTDDQGRLCVEPDDPMLEGVTIAPYVAPPAPLVPITARQLRLALLGAGITPAQVDAQIAALPSPAREAAQIEWEYATTYAREHPLIAQIGAALGMTTEQIDALWRQAAPL